MAGALPPSHLDKHHSPAGANFTSHQKKGILDHSGKHFFLYLDVAIRGNLLAGTLRTLGETVGDRSFPVWSPPLTFSPLVSAPYHRHRLHISFSWSSDAFSLASNFFQVHFDVCLSHLWYFLVASLSGRFSLWHKNFPPLFPSIHQFDLFPRWASPAAWPVPCSCPK